MEKKRRPTNHEKNLKESGMQITTWNHDMIVDYLLQVFKNEYPELLMKAAIDTSRRKVLRFDLCRNTNFGGAVYYYKKKRKFTYLQYSDRYNYAVQFSIESKAYHSCYEFYQQIKHKFPFGLSIKQGTQFLLNN